MRVLAAMSLFAMLGWSGVTRATEVPLIPLLSTEVQVHVDKSVAALAMTERDIQFEKHHGEPIWTLGWVTNALDDPLRLPVVAERIQSTAETGDAAAWWSLAGELMETPSPRTVVPRGRAPPEIVLPDALSPPLAEALEQYYRVAFEVFAGIEQSFARLKGATRQYLAASIYVPVFDTELREASRAALEAAGVPRSVQQRVEAESDLLDGTATAAAWLEDLERVELGQLLEAARLAQGAAEELLQTASAIAAWPEEPLRLETPIGDVVIGSRSDDRYDKPALLILEPGGDDTYRDEAGAANGLLGGYTAAVIDLAGDDRYESSGLLSPGAALLGVAVCLDAAGNDRHESAFSGCGSAVLGAAWFEDGEGNDRHLVQAIGQGAGVAGFGFFVDRNGNDRYEAGFYSQGFSGVKGWGLLLDTAGHDIYFAGNVKTDSDRNADRFLSLSQGFAIGARPHAGGGVAALVDLAGNDTYTADVYGQGVSYYYSAGFLLDAAGNDRYTMYQYGQGCGIHMSLGLLADANGNDLYTGYILSQGAAHDYAVGMLFDHAGDDTYTADHHAQGRALNNAFALLVDRSGSDGYFGRQRDGTQGIGNEGGFRDYGSLALLLDLGGEDIYSGGFSNGVTTLRPLYGAVYDHEGKADGE